MNKTHITKIKAFNRRMDMFILCCDRSNIISYIHGFDSGAGIFNHGWPKAISSFVAKNHAIAPDATGWAGQIDTLAQQLGKSWVDAYLLVCKNLWPEHKGE